MKFYRSFFHFELILLYSPITTCSWQASLSLETF